MVNGYLKASPHAADPTIQLKKTLRKPDGEKHITQQIAQTTHSEEPLFGYRPSLLTSPEYPRTIMSCCLGYETED